MRHHFIMTWIARKHFHMATILYVLLPRFMVQRHIGGGLLSTPLTASVHLEVTVCLSPGLRCLLFYLSYNWALLDRSCFDALTCKNGVLSAEQ